MSGLLSKTYAKSRSDLICSHQALTEIPSGNPYLSSGDTVYITVSDSAGMMVSLIQVRC